MRERWIQRKKKYTKCKIRLREGSKEKGMIRNVQAQTKCTGTNTIQKKQKDRFTKLQTRQQIAYYSGAFYLSVQVLDSILNPQTMLIS